MTGACFGCGKQGHTIKDCPNRRVDRKEGGIENQNKKQKVSGRVYALTKQDAQASNEVATGTLILFNKEAKVLFDPGATHSFVSLAFGCFSDKPPESLKYVMSVATPMGDSVIIQQVYKACQISMGEREFVVDLLPLEMCDFDVILGMDWLAAYHAVVNCFTKEVMFNIPGQAEFSFGGKQSVMSQGLINATKATRLLEKGCEGFLAYVVKGGETELCVENIPVVSEFRDVFPEDLPGLPPEREIEFGIELVPGTSPISLAPYRMTPIELKELKSQLQELLDKGFVRPSISPWGAPVLFVKKKDGTIRLCIDYRILN